VREGQIWQKFEEEHLERAFSIQEIVDCLEYAGLWVVNKFGGIRHQRPLQADSNRVWFLTRNEGSLH
jgi:hypothetical protein